MMVITVGIAIIISALGVAATGLSAKNGNDEQEQCAQRILVDRLLDLRWDSQTDLVSFDLALSTCSDMKMPEHANGFRVILKEAVEGGEEVVVAEGGVLGDSTGECVSLSQPVIVVHSATDRRAALLTVVVW